MNKLIDIPLYLSENAMIQREDKVIKQNKEDRHPYSFQPPHLLFLCLYPPPHPHTQFKPSLKRNQNQSMLCRNENEPFGLGIFILICVLAKDKRKVRKQTMQEAVEKIIIVGERRVLFHSSD
jgi:hypothetical protein